MYKYNEMPTCPRQWPEGAAIKYMCMFVCVHVYVYVVYGHARIILMALGERTHDTILLG